MKGRTLVSCLVLSNFLFYRIVFTILQTNGANTFSLDGGQRFKIFCYFTRHLSSPSTSSTKPFSQFGHEKSCIEGHQTCRQWATTFMFESAVLNAKVNPQVEVGRLVNMNDKRSDCQRPWPTLGKPLPFSLSFHSDEQTTSVPSKFSIISQQFFSTSHKHRPTAQESLGVLPRLNWNTLQQTEVDRRNTKESTVESHSQLSCHFADAVAVERSRSIRVTVVTCTGPAQQLHTLVDVCQCASCDARARERVATSIGAVEALSKLAFLLAVAGGSWR